MINFLEYQQTHPDTFMKFAKYLNDTLTPQEYQGFTNLHPFIHYFYLLDFLYRNGYNPIDMWKLNQELGETLNPTRAVEEMIRSGFTSLEISNTQKEDWE